MHVILVLFLFHYGAIHIHSVIVPDYKKSDMEVSKIVGSRKRRTQRQKMKKRNQSDSRGEERREDRGVEGRKTHLI